MINLFNNNEEKCTQFAFQYDDREWTSLLDKGWVTNHICGLSLWACHFTSSYLKFYISKTELKINILSVLLWAPNRIISVKYLVGSLAHSRTSRECILPLQHFLKVNLKNTFYRIFIITWRVVICSHFLLGLILFLKKLNSQKQQQLKKNKVKYKSKIKSGQSSNSEQKKNILHLEGPFFQTSKLKDFSIHCWFWQRSHKIFFFFFLLISLCSMFISKPCLRLCWLPSSEEDPIILEGSGVARLPVAPGPSRTAKYVGAASHTVWVVPRHPQCQQLCGVCSHQGPLIYCWSILGKSSSKAKQTDKFCSNMHWNFIACLCGGIRGSKTHPLIFTHNITRLSKPQIHTDTHSRQK